MFKFHVCCPWFLLTFFWVHLFQASIAKLKWGIFSSPSLNLMFLFLPFLRYILNLEMSWSDSLKTLKDMLKASWTSQWSAKLMFIQLEVSFNCSQLVMFSLCIIPRTFFSSSLTSAFTQSFNLTQVINIVLSKLMMLVEMVMLVNLNL